MLTILSDVLMIAARTHGQPSHRDTRCPDPAQDDRRRRVWSRIAGIRF